MTLHLHFANRFEPLVSELSEALDRHWIDFGTPPPVVVPSPAVAKWLKLRLCEVRGALVGLPTPTLEGFLWKALDPDPEMKILRVDALQQALIPLLNEVRLETACYRPVREYLCPHGKIELRRRCQLAHELARLFLEYEYNRPSVWKDGAWGVRGLDQAWPDHSYFAKPEGAEEPAEIWQRDLHGAVFAPTGPLAESGRLGLPRLHRIRREAGWKPSGEAVMVFGVEKVSHFHRNFLHELAVERTVHLFLVNPCAEYWEDVETSRRPRRRQAIATPRFAPGDYQASELSGRLYPASQSGQGDPLLLERWGHSPRVSLSLWSQAVDYNFDFAVEAPLPAGAVPTVLGVLQQCLVQRHPGPVQTPLELESGVVLDGPLARDASLLLLDCPERGRELEAVRDQILDWLAGDKKRSAADVVVLMPDPARHRTAIHRVFGGYAPGDPAYLPWAMLGESVGESQWARAVESLLALAKGRCDRASVFGLLRNRLVQARLGVEAATVGRWENWAELAGMIRGWDAAHRVELGDDPDSALDTHTFKAGILRLLMAPLAKGSFEAGLRIPGGMLERVPVARDFESDSAEVESFAACLERLFHDVRALGADCRDRRPSEAVKQLVATFDAWIGFDDGAESKVRRDLLESLELVGLQEKAGRQQLSLDELAEIVTSLLDGELPGNARAFAGSVTFAPLKSGHVLPHGFVVLCGFDAKSFPGDGLRTRLDLLASAPLVGDADAVRDNRALFLEAVLSARSRLVVSWLGRDIQKDERLEPASVVLELEEALGKIVATSCRSRLGLLARETIVGETEADRWLPASWDPSDRVVGAVAASDPWKVGVQPGAGAVRLTVSDLKSFLSDSFLYHLRRTLGWEVEDGAGTLEAEHETLGVSKLDEAVAKTELLPVLADLVWKGEAGAVEAWMARFAAAKIWSAAFPEALLAKAEAEKLLRWARSLVRQLEATRDVYPDHRLVCGADLSLSVPGKPAVLEWVVAGRKVVLSQRIACALVNDRPGAPAVLLVCNKVNGLKTKASTVDRARAFGSQLQAMVLGLCGFEVRVITFAREPDVTPADLPGLVASVSWLETVIADLLDGENQYLPIRPILELGLDKLNLVALREKLLDSEFSDDLEDLFEPLLPGEAEQDAKVLEALVQRRLGPFLGGTHGA